MQRNSWLDKALRKITQEHVNAECCIQVLVHEVRPSPKEKPATDLVLGRGLLLYRWLDLSTIPIARRTAVVAAQLKAWSPFAEKSDYLIAWFPSSVGMFAWDMARLESRLETAEIKRINGQRLIPEPWLSIVPHGDSVRLVKLLEGYEGQVWKDASLRISRWWAEQPSEVEWLNFLRGATIPPSAMGTPTITQQDILSWQPEGWGKLSTLEDLTSAHNVWETLGLITTSLALMSASAVVARDYWDLHQQIARAEQHVAQLEFAAQPGIQSRNAALREIQANAALGSNMQGVEPLLILEHVIMHLPEADGIFLRQWELAGRDLRVTLDVPPGISRSAIVTALEEGMWLTDVREARDTASNQLALTMTLRNNHPPVAPVSTTKTSKGLQSSPSAANSASSTQ